jgi:hypothetical protein
LESQLLHYRAIETSNSYLFVLAQKFSNSLLWPITGPEVQIFLTSESMAVDRREKLSHCLNHFLAAREKVWKKFENHSFNLY